MNDEEDTPLGMEVNECGFHVSRIIACLNHSNDSRSEKAAADVVALAKEHVKLKKELADLHSRLEHENKHAAALDRQLIREVAINNTRSQQVERLGMMRLTKFHAKMDVFMNRGRIQPTTIVMTPDPRETTAQAVLRGECFSVSGNEKASSKTCVDCRDKDVDPDNMKHRCFWCGLGRWFQFWLWRPKKRD